MIAIGKILESVISGDFRKIKITRFGKSDTQTPYQVAPHGIDSCPVKNSKGVVAGTMNDNEPVMLGVFNVEKTAEAGEIRIYSTNASGVLKNEIFLRANGDIEIGGTGNFLAKYNELATAFNSLKSDFNTFLVHVHGPAGSPPAPPALPNTADISGAKADKLKTS